MSYRAKASIDGVQNMNSDIAIRVENLSKRYRIGVKEQMHDTFIGAVTDFLRQPVLNFRKLRRLTKFDGENGEDIIWALKDVSFEVKRGEVVGIIGRNGAGKSTLLKILARITDPTSGRAIVNGRIGSLLEVGTGMHPELTGRENIYLSGTILGMRKAEIDRKFDEIVEFAEIGKFIDTPIKRYSSGMKVRLGFAIAAHLEPEILLVDEVLAVGDAAFQKKCLGKMGEVAKEGRTVLFVSHNMGAIASLTERSICLNGGQIIADGKTKKTIEAYISKVVGNSGKILTGFMDLTRLPRPKNIINPVAQFEWVRLKDRNGIQKGVFKEGESIIIEVGFRIDRRTKDLQFGFGIRSLRLGIELFVTPSKLYPEIYEPGKYIIAMNMEPNYLRPGKYSPVLKMFAEGRRQETFGETVVFSIEKVDKDTEAMGYEIWRSGPLRLEFNWEDVERV